MKDRKHDIEKYLRGELSPAEMHSLEKEALNDPFLAEALEGVEQAGADNFLYDLHRLNRKVHDRTRHRKDRTIRMWGSIAGIAAAVLLVAVSGFLVVSLLNDKRAQEQALNKPAQPETTTPFTNSDTVSSSGDSVTTPARAEARAPSKEPEATDEQAAPAPIAGAVPREQNDEVVAGAEIPVRQEAQQDQTTDNGSAPAERKPEDVAALSPTEIADHDVALSDISETDVSKKEIAKVEEKEISEALQGRAAGVRAKTGAVTRSADARYLKGRVTSAADGEGLPGVSVVVKGADIGAVTDGEGNYQLQLPAASNTLVFSFIGFETLEAKPDDGPVLNITLHEDVAALSEVVVVTGYGRTNNTNGEAVSFRAAEPRGGKSDFRDYLSTAVRYPEEALRKNIEGRVTVRFSVEPDGQLTNFEVIKGLGAGCEEELIRAIKEGPLWNPAARGDVPVGDKVKVRFKFKLPK